MEYKYSIDGNERPSEAVINAMAERADCSPLELKPLGTVIDPEALDAVLNTGTRSKVTFRCYGAAFTVTQEEIRIEDQGDANETD